MTEKANINQIISAWNMPKCFSQKNRYYLRNSYKYKLNNTVILKIFCRTLNVIGKIRIK